MLASNNSEWSSDDSSSDLDDIDDSDENGTSKADDNVGELAPGESIDLLKSVTKGKWKNRQRVLIFCSRGATALHRHLMEASYELI